MDNPKDRTREEKRGAYERKRRKSWLREKMVNSKRATRGLVEQKIQQVRAKAKKRMKNEKIVIPKYEDKKGKSFIEIVWQFIKSLFKFHGKK